jgi:hypothetical protein
LDHFIKIIDEDLKQFANYTDRKLVNIS